MHSLNHNLQNRSIVRTCLTLVTFAAVTTVAQAQNYYYYYPSTGGTPGYGAPAAGGSYYYAPATYSNQPAWNGYAPQYYQATYPRSAYQPSYVPQYYQTGYAQPTYPQATQPAAAGPQYVQTSYVQQNAQPAATAAPAATTPAAATPAAANGGAAPTTASATTTPAATAPAGDAYGFTAWLNATRASYGLPAVGYDPNLESWAAVNSAQQAARGLGHFVMGPARRQNSAMGGYPGIESMWMASPAHRAALLDPTIQWIGIAAYGAYWTFNVRHGI